MGSHDKAELLYRRVILVWPDHLGAMLGLAKAWLGLARLHDVLPHLDRLQLLLSKRLASTAHPLMQEISSLLSHIQV